VRTHVTDPEASAGDERTVLLRPAAREDTRATPIMLPAIVMRPPSPPPENDWPVLVAARRAAEDAWIDFLEGEASVYELMRARNTLSVLIRRKAASEAWRRAAPDARR